MLMQIADAISRLAIENSHDPENIAIPFEDDSVQNRLIENIDLEKAIMTYHASQHEVSGTHTGVVNRDGTAMAVPKSSDNTPEKSTIAAMENFSDWSHPPPPQPTSLPFPRCYTLISAVLYFDFRGARAISK